MEVPEKLRDLAISESGFLFDPYTGATFNTNAVGVVILEELKAGATREEILAHLREHFDVRGDDLERDLDDFIHLLEQNELVPRHFSLD